MKNRKSLKYLLALVLCAALITAGTGMAALAQSPDLTEDGEIVTEDQAEDSAADGLESSGEEAGEDQNGLPSEEAGLQGEASEEGGTGSEAAAGEPSLSDQVSEDQDPDSAAPSTAGTGSEQIEEEFPGWRELRHCSPHSCKRGRIHRLV